jgi:hypothetical protein
MIKLCFYLVLYLASACSYSQSVTVYYGTAGEGYSSPTTGENIDLSYRKFSAPMATEVCGPFAGDLMLSSPQPAIVLFPGEAFSLTELKVDAIRGSGEYVQNLPIVIGVPEIENGFLNHRPYELSLEAVGPGSMSIEIMGYCNPNHSEYLTLTVVNTTNETINGTVLSIPEDWALNSEQQTGSDNVITLINNETNFELKVKQMNMPGTITAEKLRALTNISDSVVLNHEDWGDYSGFHHEYFENNRFYMHWWLALENNLLLVSYAGAEINNIEKAIVKKIISSLKKDSR